MAFFMMALSISGAMPPITVSNQYAIPVNTISDKIYLTYGSAIPLIGNISVNNTVNSSVIGSGSTISLNAASIVSFSTFLFSILYVVDGLQVNDSLSPIYRAELWINGSIPSDLTIFAHNNTSNYILSGNNSFNLSNTSPLYLSFFAVNINNSTQNFSLYFNYVIDNEIVIEYTYNFVID